MIKKRGSHKLVDTGIVQVLNGVGLFFIIDGTGEDPCFYKFVVVIFVEDLFAIFVGEWTVNCVHLPPCVENEVSIKRLVKLGACREKGVKSMSIVSGEELF